MCLTLGDVYWFSRFFSLPGTYAIILSILISLLLCLSSGLARIDCVCALVIGILFVLAYSVSCSCWY
ncbi:hypothetical protein M6B38_320605 [Iris pallida]|uniref:NADH dehydrogenase subunit 6 n=1 Tax=Iris pallida TaxID=29817 RepID=A0AAX6HC10_IRIPA|nr:hypothetical protein M6B38_320605 [Iris pallida]